MGTLGDIIVGDMRLFACILWGDNIMFCDVMKFGDEMLFGNMLVGDIIMFGCITMFWDIMLLGAELFAVIMLIFFVWLFNCGDMLISRPSCFCTARSLGKSRLLLKPETSWLAFSSTPEHFNSHQKKFTKTLIFIKEIIHKHYLIQVKCKKSKE